MSGSQPQPARRGLGIVLAGVLAAALVHAVVAPGVARAQTGPSVPLPQPPPVPGTQQTMQPRPPDESTQLALHGDQPPGRTALPGGGTYTATSLNPSATWQVSAQTGDFSWSYPLRVPPAAGGLQPNLALSYSSSAVDGLTSASNTQASWVGDGWSLWPGFIERTYGSCVDDLPGSGVEPADRCWHSDNATMSLNGGATDLIGADWSGWRPRNDDGSRVERLAGAANGDDNGEHWKITTVDGTQYFFGSRPDAKSTWTVPVFGDDGGEPCNTGTFATSSCTQAYRWNLDKVIDRNGNMLLYFYETETNHYGRNQNTSAAPYVRNGWLDRIEYGLRSDQTLTASGRVRFEVADRCVPGSTCTPDRPENWPDVAWSSRCDGGSCPDKWSPTFWTTKRLSKVVAEVWDGATYLPADSWTLRHEFPEPGDGEKPALWLKGITHTGHAGGGSASVPEVQFEGVRKANRVYNPGTGDGHAALIRFRMNAIVSESGGVISIRYAEPNCVYGSAMPANPESNTMRCFPVRWAASGSPERTDYFHKYVVESVSELDRLGTSVPAVTSYEYLDGAAWHFDESELTPQERKTWNGYRGYGRVRVRTGSGYDGPVTLSEQRFYRGMNGDRLPSGTRTATVADSESGIRADEPWLNGFELESTTYSGDGGPAVTKTIGEPSWQGPTATRGDLSAYIVRTGVQRDYTALEAGGWRTTRTETSYDDRGLPTAVNDLGDTTTVTDDRCTTTTYLRNTAAWLLSFPSRMETVSVRCGQPPAFPQHAISDVRTSYDLQAHTAAPVKGNPSTVEILDQRPAAGPVYAVAATAKYDAHGRITERADGLNRISRTAYTPAVGGPATQVVTTDPANFVTTTDLDRATGQPLKIVDPNNRRTEIAYDALGRTIEVWLPGRNRPTYGGNYKFSYLVRNDAPTVVTTTKLGPTANYTSSNAIFDGLLRPRQTQHAAVGTGRLLTDTRYDSHGRAHKATQPYFDSAPVDTNLWLASDTDVPGMTVTEFDGAGRPTAQIFRGGGIEKWRTTTSYGGDRVHVVPPAGGTATTAIADARGRTTELRQYTTAGLSSQFVATTYTYTAAGQLASVRDYAGNTWTYGYDLRGRKISSTDPDKGASSFGYDAADQLISSTDARGSTLEHGYDVLGRKTATHLVPSTGPKVKLADWTYDTAIGGKGQLATATRWVDGNAYIRRVTGYTGLYQPLRTDIVIPASEGTLAGTYLTQFGYKPDGTQSSEYYGPTPDLVGETVMHVLDDYGRVSETSGGFGTTIYASATEYTRYGELARTTLGSSPKRAWLSYYYDDHSRRLNRMIVDAEVPSPMVADLNYSYDPAGNITKLADTPLGQPADTQCFRHDQLRRLTEAWTPSGGDCGLTPSAAALGGPAPYWHSYSYDAVGNRLSETQHASAGDVVRTYGYPAAGTPQPHTLDSVTVTRPGQPAAVDTFDYDATGNTTSRALAGRPGQTLTWDVEGHLSRVVENGQTTEFIYDANGARLLRKDPTAVTLYLEGQEIRLTKATGARVTTRYYTHAGEVVGMRQGSTVTYLATDHQGSNQIAINASTQAVSRRRQLPFGAPRGAAPPMWPDEKGFVGGTLDSSTGLTHLGAREYDPATGRFISVDPIMDLADPQQMHGYAYANNNPVTWSDPSGLIIYTSCPDGVCRPGQGIGANQNTGKSNPTRTYGNVPVITSGGSDGRCADGARTCRAVRGSIPSSKLLTPRPVDPAPTPLQHMLNCRNLHTAVDPSSGCSPHDLTRAITYEGLGGPDAEACVAAYGSGPACAMFIAGFIPGGGWGVRGTRVATKVLGAFGRHVDEAADVAKAACSFTGDTRVLMADGSTKRMAEIKIGDEVQALDPETGRRGSRKVTAVWAHSDMVIDLQTVDGVVSTAEDHLFWNQVDRQWQRADELGPSDGLLTSSGGIVAVIGLRPGTARPVIAYNLSVADLHTYYIMAGQSLLVHNECKSRQIWQITKDGTAATARHGRFGTFAKSKSDGLWWSPDTAGHGGSAWKVYEERADGLHWVSDADQYGDFISGKHKSSVGTFIPWKELSMR